MTGPIIRPGSTSVNIITGATDQDFIGIGDSADLPDVSTALATKLDVTTASSTYAPVSSLRTTITYNGDGTVATVTETVSGAVTTYTYNADGTPATESRVLAGVTTLRTFSYTGGNLVGVS